MPCLASLDCSNALKSSLGESLCLGSDPSKTSSSVCMTFICFQVAIRLSWATSFILSDSRHWYHKSMYAVLKKASQQATLLVWVLASQLNAWKRMLVERPRPEKQQKCEKVSGIVISVSQEKIKYTDSFILQSTG